MFNTISILKKALKILAIALLLAATVVPAQAQRRVIHYLPKYENEPYHFGFLLAFNEMMYTVKTVDDYQNIELDPESWPDGPFNPTQIDGLYVYNVETHQRPGFTVGIIGSKRLGRYFDLRLIPSLSFCDRQLKYIVIKDINGNLTPTNDPLEPSIFTTFVEFPLNIKYRSKRYNNIGAYIMGGINPKLDLSSNKQSYNQVTGNFTNFVTKRFDLAGELGVGFDIYNQWFKMGIEVKMSYGLLDVVKNDAGIYTAPIEQLRNKLFQVSLLIE